MKRALSNSELDENLRYLIFSNDLYYNSTQHYLTDLYNTGCRPIELLRKESWKDNGEAYTLVTAKTNEIRTINKLSLSPIFNHCFENNIEPYMGLTYDKILLEFQRLFPLPAVYCGNKKVDTYLFRYNKARQMFENKLGFDIIQK